MRWALFLLFAVLGQAYNAQACTCPDSLSMADRGYTVRVVPSPSYSTLTFFVDADSTSQKKDFVDALGAHYSIQVYHTYPSTREHPGGQEEWSVAADHVYSGGTRKTTWKVPAPFFEGSWTVDVTFPTTVLRVKLR